jgi:hypothetical protein
MTRQSAVSWAMTALVACLASAACHKAASESASSDAAVDASHPDEGTAAVLPPRCQLTSRALAVEPSEETEIGDAVPFPGGIAVGVVHRTASGRMAAVATIPTGLASLRLIDLRPTLGDAPPPRLAWRGKDLLVAAYVLPSKAGKSDAPHDLAVWALDPSSPESPGGAGLDREPIATLARERGDSLSFDVAQVDTRALFVWDETTTAAPRGARRGVIRAVPLSDRAEPARELFPPEPEADAEMARVVPNGAGFFVLWLARRPEATGAISGRDASTDERPGAPEPAASRAESPQGREGEATGEARAFSWVEMVAVDAHGAPAAPVRRLTPATGHVSAFDVTVLAREPKSTLLIVARDDGEAVDGSGGGLLRVRAGADFAEAPLELPSDGLGRGAPGLVQAAPPWLTWIDSRERLRLLALDAAGAPAGRSSAEEPLGEGRPLLWVDPQQLLVARPTGEGGAEAKAELAVARCSR